MTTDLDDALRTAGADLHLHRPVAGVLARGDLLRRRRRGRLAVAGSVAVVTVCASAAALVVSGEGRTTPGPAGTPTAVPTATDPAAPTPSPSSSSTPRDADRAAVVTACRMVLDGLDVRVGSTPVALDSHGDLTLAIYRSRTVQASCTAERRPDGTYEGRGGSSGPWEPIPAGRSFRGGEVRSSTDPDGTRAVFATIWVSRDVARVVVTAAGQALEAEIVDGVAFVWAPDGVRLTDLGASRTTTYAADGTVLDEGPTQPETAG